jgi:hypothetical protein
VQSYHREEKNMSHRIIRSIVFIGIVMITVLSFTQGAQAECNAERCFGKITRLYPQSSGAAVSPERGVVFIGTDGTETNLSCTPVSNVYITLFPNQKLFKEIYAALLNGITYDLTMQVRIDPNSATCKVLYVTIEREP